MNNELYIGVDIGGTNLKYGIVDSAGNIVCKSVKSTPIEKLNEFINCVETVILELLSGFENILSIGIGVPGVVDKSGVIHVSPNLPFLKGVNLSEELKSKFSIPVSVENDANVAAIAELELGAGRALNDFIYVTLGTGVGGAIITDRKIFKGSIGGAGEIGHLIIDCSDYGIKENFRSGTLELLIGKDAITGRMNNLISSSGINVGFSESLDVKNIADLAEQGNSNAVECLKITGRFLGIGLASAMNLLDIPEVIIGGGISQSGNILLDSAYETIKVRALPPLADRATITKAYFGNDAGLVGSALLGKNNLSSK